MRPALLAHLLDRAKDRIDAIRLRPDLVTRRIDERQDRLDRIWRLAESLHPDRPLRLGYVRVEKRGGGVIASADAAKTAGALTLHFADGAVDVRTDRGGKASAAPAPTQPDLF